ncbi:MAG: methyltransferase domain-containing protein [Cyanobacteria bacterium P01_E01_bin.42]
MESYYREDLAYIHDAGFGHFAENAALMLIKLLRQQGKNSGFIIDLGCGSGIAIAKLQESGYNCLGIDISIDAIAKLINSICTIARKS